jgi:DNA-directed RNA polymerase specialized sigma24 family protein
MEPANDREVRRLLEKNDRILGPLILAGDDDARRAAAGSVLVAHARPVIHGILSRYRGPDAVISEVEAEDIAATVMLRLVQRLQSVTEDEGEGIVSLADFAATLTFNAVYDFMRRRFPERTRLKNRVRYVTSRDPRFRTWSSGRGILCALESSLPPDNVAKLPPPAWRMRRNVERDSIAAAIEALLAEAGRPMLIDDLVRSLAELWHVVDVQPVELTMNAPDPARPHNIRLQKRQYLVELWRQILALRVPQRAALLLNLRDADGGNAAALFVLAAIATFDEIAAAIEVTPAQLTALWQELPLDDLAIAERLGLTRQQVINLRKAARARLARRMGTP